MTETETTTHVVKVKCTGCGLHFSAFSWRPDWRPAFCPECGSQKGFLIWRELSDEFIFQHVPGGAELAELP
jgi:hypothetical protein